MAEQLNQWLDRFVENGSDPNNVPDWPENSGVKVQSDWAQEDNTQPDFIKNKPIINDVSDLIKSDAQGNVYINKGFQEVYTLAAEFDATKTYYESYIPITISTLTGTWEPQSSKVPSSIVIGFSEGDAFAEGFSDGTALTYLDSITAATGSQINRLNMHYYKDGVRKEQMGPMYWDRWNSHGFSFSKENEIMYNFMTQYFTKISDKYYDNNHIDNASIRAWDQEDPSYRVIELTEQTFIPNTYYTYERVPQWVNVKDLI